MVMAVLLWKWRLMLVMMLSEIMIFAGNYILTFTLVTQLNYSLKLLLPTYKKEKSGFFRMDSLCKV